MKTNVALLSSIRFRSVFIPSYEALKREVMMLQEENLRLRRMQEYFINPRLLPIPPKE
jgi:hypothetical protein